MASSTGSATPPAAARGRVALVTLGCARNEVDSEELAARLEAGGWELVNLPDGDEPGAAPDAVLVNTCGFVEAAKQDSVEALLAAGDLAGPDGSAPAVVAVGCLAERYGRDLAAELPEAAVLSFDDYAGIADAVEAVVEGRAPQPHVPRDRRTLLPLAPADRRSVVDGPHRSADGPVPGRPAAGPPVLRRRLGTGPVAPLKLASGCDRRCSFCAIPSFRGSFLSRTPQEILDEAEWLAGSGVREVVLVSENSTSYGKDLGDLRALESLLPRIAEVPGIARVRVAYLQPAEMRPSLIDAIVSTAGAADYFDLSFQHSSADVLRRMRRFGGTDAFLDLLASVRAASPAAGARSNVIVGFPGETEADVEELEQFLSLARLDAIGVFGYSAEDGTEAAGFDDALDPDVVRERVERIAALADELMAQRAEDRVGSTVRVLVEDLDEASGTITGRAEHQGPETDGEVVAPLQGRSVAVGDLIDLVVVDHDGADLVASWPGTGAAPQRVDGSQQGRGR